MIHLFSIFSEVGIDQYIILNEWPSSSQLLLLNSVNQYPPTATAARHGHHVLALADIVKNAGEVAVNVLVGAVGGYYP